ncbi:hypothetical protein J2S10_005161 [Neobacillus ginsengisoli]|uniref:Uncharacterized protein n=1 Tax=Neobacillus ginsengisoli TaxID=904295 RepID=A0ABT9Y2A8_9BACI|nr:hypothetical protein [Neobacillus ginsengisoli]
MYLIDGKFHIIRKEIRALALDVELLIKEVADIKRKVIKLGHSNKDHYRKND